MEKEINLFKYKRNFYKNIYYKNSVFKFLMKYNKSINLMLLTVFFYGNIFAQKHESFKNYSDKAIYLVCRATYSKTEVIAKKFNIQDTLITHIGIGFLQNDSLKIFHITPKKFEKKKSSLVSENLFSFTESSDVFYYSIWSKEISRKKMKNFKKNLSKMKELYISFDTEFKMKNGNLLYCSEFIYDILLKSKIGRKNLNSFPIKKELVSFYELILQRKILSYIPVDFFQQDTKFKKEYESFKK